MRGAIELGFVSRSKPRWPGPADLTDEVRTVKRLGNVLRGDIPATQVIVIRTQTADLVRTLVPWIEVGFVKGPSAIRQALALLEIHLVEGGTPTSPMIRCATEIAQPARGEIEIWPADVATDVELLRVVLGRQRTALEQDDTE